MNALTLFVDSISRGDVQTLRNLPDSFVDDCQKVLLTLDQAGGRHDKRNSSLRHLFCHNMYIREITMNKGAIIVSRKHKTQHPFTVSKGVVTVFIPGVGLQLIKAPYTGITQPNTKRLLYINEETVWTTYHVNLTGETNPDQIVVDITEPEEIEFDEIKTLEEVFV